MITYQKEKLFDIFDEISPLLEKHYEEIALYKDKIKYKPDWEKYKSLEKAEVLKVATVRDEGELVGYYFCFVLPNPHYSDDLYSVNDIVLIKPEYRKGKIGKGLFEYVERWMKSLNVSVMTVHMKTFLPFDSLCEGLDWDYSERLYTKCIKE